MIIKIITLGKKEIKKVIDVCIVLIVGFKVQEEVMDVLHPNRLKGIINNSFKEAKVEIEE